eukprot:scaffold323862_cov39-Prasinocladus_malaysianus.AAC.1
MALAEEGQRVISGTNDGRLKVWRLPYNNAQLVKAYDKSLGPINAEPTKKDSALLLGSLEQARDTYDGDLDGKHNPPQTITVTLGQEVELFVQRGPKTLAASYHGHSSKLVFYLPVPWLLDAVEAFFVPLAGTDQDDVVVC